MLPLISQRRGARGFNQKKTLMIVDTGRIARGALLSLQPPQNRACPSPSTRLKHITSTTAPSSLPASTIEPFYFLLSALLGR
jgi:hypothetical protein